MLVRILSKVNANPLLVKGQTYSATMEISVVFPQKDGNLVNSRYHYHTLGYIPTKMTVHPPTHALSCLLLCYL